MDKKTIYIIGAITVIGLFFFLKGGTLTAEGVVSNGECTPPTEDLAMTECCYDVEDEEWTPVSCTSQTQAIYRGVPGVQGRQYGIGLSNDGNLILDEAYIQSVTVTPSDVELNECFGELVYPTGSMSSKDSVAVAAETWWSTATGALGCNMDNVADGSYTVDLVAFAKNTATGATATQTYTITFTIEQEVISFSLDVTEA